jgi:hypothetical protein
MSKVVLIEKTASLTQSVEAVVELLSFLGKPANSLPEVVDLNGMMLVLSNKKDVFYTTTSNSCSCPSSIYRPGQRCKHQRKYFPSVNTTRQGMSGVLEEHDANLSRMPANYRRMVRAACDEADAEPLELKPKGSFKPFLE